MAKNENNPIPAIKLSAQDRSEKQGIFADKYNPKSKGYGIVYLLTNPFMPGLVKIGMTAQEDIDKRMKELYTTGVPVPFECRYACKVNKNDCISIEKW